MEYFGTIFVAVIAFWLGYVLGKILTKRKFASIVSDIWEQFEQKENDRS
jgi:hypothetical protein